MRVISRKKFPDIDVNAECLVLAMRIVENTGIEILINNKHNKPSIYSTAGFEFLDEIIPNTWTTSIIEDRAKKSMIMLPRNWDYPDFLSNLEAGKKEEIRLYKNEIE